jgi:hypothetical protein
METLKKQIVLTGKETKSQLIKLLVEIKPKFEYSDMDSEDDFRKNTKPELLKSVKMYNTNVENGGNGNISFYRNEEGFIPSKEVSSKFQDFLKEQGIEKEEDFKNKFGYHLSKLMNDDYNSFVEKELNGIVGNTEVEIALDKAIEIYNKYSKM